MAQALHGSTATDLAGLKSAMSALDPGAAPATSVGVGPGAVLAMSSAKIKCYFCQELGHKATECPLRAAGLPAVPPAPAIGQSFVSGQVSSAGAPPYVRPGVHALTDADVATITAALARSQADARQLAEAYLQASQGMTEAGAGGTAEDVQAGPGGLNALGRVSWKEQVATAFASHSRSVPSDSQSAPAAYVDWTHGPSFLEYPANEAQMARTMERARRVTEGWPSAEPLSPRKP